MKKVFLCICIFILCFVHIAYAKHKKLEKEYVHEWCEPLFGYEEYVLPDKTRCDCVVIINELRYAIEFDFGEKWAESIGQALYYGLQTEYIPGIVLILEDEKEYRYFLRANSVIQHWGLPIKIWIIENYTLSNILYDDKNSKRK